ncbi:MAG: Re/Si-specific NAD(P)(+) transhydrogenase subunit alpha [Planctomycetota bacterium]
MKLGVPKETYEGERRVAIVPTVLPQLIKAGCEVIVETDAGRVAGFSNADYEAKGAKIVSRGEALDADIVAQVRGLGCDADGGKELMAHAKPGQTVVATCDPLGEPEAIRQFAESGANLLALELIPRITRAQSMDVLSSMATVAGYRAVLLAALELPQMFPLLMTAAGTISPARTLVIGAGVAGLQAIATARRLGAVVHGYDVRPAAREQVESLGGKFVELDLETEQSEDKSGYAKSLGEEFYERQRAQLADVIADCDVVISTAAIPGKASPLLINDDAVQRMHAGSVIVDLAAERGGNCGLSEPNQRVVAHDVTILGPTNLPGEVPFDASQMFARNVTNLLLSMIKDGKLEIDLEDEVISGTLATHAGEVVHARLREILDLPPWVPESERPIKLDD